ncbi:hypothetical protein Tco_1015857 [Tanacetum coccineum]|uniref:Uncharacterized protein n=1 Tax=Tanacetum coccineum TaxID=301880 RepID=A0ABQ5FNV5_9ASTR
MLPFYCTPLATTDVVILDPTLEDLIAGTPSSKIVAKAEASYKRKASTSGATSIHVAKRTRYALAQSSSSTTRPSLFVGDDDEIDNDDDDDACVKITLVTPLRSAAMIPSLGNQGGSSTAPTAEDSQGKGLMVDDVAAPSAGASRPRPSSGPAPSFRNVSGDAIHTDFFPFSASPYYATYPVDGVARNCDFTQEEWDAPYRPTFGVLTKEVFKDLAIYKTIVDRFPTPGLKGYEEKVASLTGLELQVSALKKQVFGLNGKLSSSDASFTKSKEKRKERKKKIKSLTKTTVLEAKKDEEILRLKTTPSEFSSFFYGQFQVLVRKFLAFNEFSRVEGELLSLAASVGFERGLSMHRTKDEFAAALKKMANFMPELSTNVNFTAFTVASEHNEEMGISIALDDAVELVELGSGRVSSGPNDVVVALSAQEKGDGLDPSSAAGEEAAANPYGV